MKRPLLQFLPQLSFLTSFFDRWLAISSTFGLQSSFAEFQDFYEQQHTPSASRINWIGSTLLFLIMHLPWLLSPENLLIVDTFVTYFSSDHSCRPSRQHKFCIVELTAYYRYFIISTAHNDKWYQLFLSQYIGTGLVGGSNLRPMSCGSVAPRRRHRSMARGVIFTGQFMTLTWRCLRLQI